MLRRQILHLKAAASSSPVSFPSLLASTSSNPASRASQISLGIVTPFFLAHAEIAAAASAFVMSPSLASSFLTQASTSSLDGNLIPFFYASSVT